MQARPGERGERRGQVAIRTWAFEPLKPLKLPGRGGHDVGDVMVQLG
jgi:hypothetical protein